MKLIIQNGKIAAIATDDYEGEETWILAPEDFDENQSYRYLYVNGELVFQATTEEEVWTKIKEERERRINNSGVKIDDNWFHSDLAFRAVINQACRLFTIDALPEDHPQKLAILSELNLVRNSLWKTMANTFVTPSHLLAIRIDAAHAVLTGMCHYRAEIHKATMIASGNPESYNFLVNWPAAFTDPPPPVPPEEPPP